MRRVRLLKTTKQIVAAIRAGTPLSKLLMVVYHRGHRVRLRKIVHGFQPTPYRCPKCRVVVKDPEQLRYHWAVPK